jgi:hypothetical protein
MVAMPAYEVNTSNRRGVSRNTRCHPRPRPPSEIHSGAQSPEPDFCDEGEIKGRQLRQTKPERHDAAVGARLATPANPGTVAEFEKRIAREDAAAAAVAGAVPVPASAAAAGAVPVPASAAAAGLGAPQGAWRSQAPLKSSRKTSDRGATGGRQAPLPWAPGAPRRRYTPSRPPRGPRITSPNGARL